MRNNAKRRASDQERPEWDTAEVRPALVMYNIEHPGRNVLYAFGGFRCE